MSCSVGVGSKACLWTEDLDKDGIPVRKKNYSSWDKISSTGRRFKNQTGEEQEEIATPSEQLLDLLIKSWSLATSSLLLLGMIHVQ